MINIKKYLLIGFASIVIVSSLGITNVMANDNNGVIDQIKEVRNSLNNITARVETIVNDILGLKNNVSTIQSDIKDMKDIIAKQEEEIGYLKNVIKTQSGTSNELVTIKLGSFSKPFNPWDPAFKDSQWSATLPMANKQIYIKNINDPENTYTYTLDENGKCEIIIPAGWYMFDIPAGQSGTTTMKVTYIVSPNVKDPKIAIVQYGNGTYTNSSTISNLFNVLVQENSDTRVTNVFDQF